MASTTKVQHVNKASSDELLQKFAELGSKSRDKPSRKRELQVVKHPKRCRTERKDEEQGSPLRNGVGLVERRSLLPRSARRSALFRQLGLKGVKNKSLLGTIGKTWRKTVEGASKVFIESHYHRHKRLISDAI